jgi:hypothetical protein
LRNFRNMCFAHNLPLKDGKENAETSGQAIVTEY